MQYIILLVLLAMFIAFVVMVVKASRNWRWYHITTAVITMLLALVFLFPTARAMKSRREWHKVKEDLEVRLGRVEAENRAIRYGDSSDSTAPIGLEDLTLELSKIGIEAGRRWRNLQLASKNDQTIEVTLRSTQGTSTVVPGQPAQPNQPDAGPLVPSGLVVYAFAEGKFPEMEKLVPTTYLGEFKVTNSGNGSVTITPTFPLENDQTNAIRSGRAASWSLYEMLPLDGHTPFIADGSATTEDNVLGRVDDQLVNMLFRADQFQNITEPPADQELTNQQKMVLEFRKRMRNTIENYLKDGSRGAPENKAAAWVKIRFEKKYSLDVDSPEQRGALDGPFFDNNGRSLDVRLQRGEPGTVSFAPGDELLVKEEASTQLIQDEIATVVDKFYMRPLNDYRYALRRLRLQITQLNAKIENMKYQKQILDTAIAATFSMLEKRQNEQVLLEEDLGQFRVENTALRQYHGQIREDLRRNKEASSALYRSNLSLLRQIQALSNSQDLTDT